MSLANIFSGPPEPTPAVSASIDDVAHILRVERRRAVIRHMDTADGPLELRELSQRIASEELPDDKRVVGSQEYKRVYVGLYQSHLDDMAALGIVEYDDRSKTIHPGPELDGYAGLLDTLEARTDGPTAVTDGGEQA